MLSLHDNPALTEFPGGQISQSGRATARPGSNRGGATADRQAPDGFTYSPPVMRHVQAKRPSSLRMIDCRISADIADHEPKASELWRFTALPCEASHPRRAMNHQNVCGALIAKRLWLADFDLRPDSSKEMQESAKIASGKEEISIGQTSQDENRVASLFAFWRRRDTTNDARHLKDVPGLDVFVRARTQDTSQAQVMHRVRTLLRAEFTREAEKGLVMNALHVLFGPSSHLSRYLHRASERTARRALSTGQRPLPLCDLRRGASGVRCATWNA